MPFLGSGRTLRFSLTCSNTPGSSAAISTLDSSRRKVKTYGPAAPVVRLLKHSKSLHCFDHNRRTCLAVASTAKASMRRRIRGRRSEVFVVEALGHGRFRVNGRLAYAVGEKQRTWVFIEGHTYV